MSPNRRRVAVAIRHVAFEDLGNLTPQLTRAGFDIEVLDAGVDDARIAELGDADLWVVLGGPISVNDGEDYPFLALERRILAERIDRQRPTLGICLGAQLMAAALGARVYAGPVKEIGWASVHRNGGTGPHPVDALARADLPVLHWHGETWELPSGATRLLSSDAYVEQAFEVGTACLGLQFHPEATAAGLERWYIGHCGEIAATQGLSVASLRADGRKHARALEAASQDFFGAWLARASVGIKD